MDIVYFVIVFHHGVVVLFVFFVEGEAVGEGVGIG